MNALPPGHGVIPSRLCPTPKDSFADLALPQSGWHQLYVGPVDRMASGPNGQQAQVRDAVIALERCMKTN